MRRSDDEHIYGEYVFATKIFQRPRRGEIFVRFCSGHAGPFRTNSLPECECAHTYTLA